jgi:hypothetical protein
MPGHTVNDVISGRGSMGRWSVACAGAVAMTLLLTSQALATTGDVAGNSAPKSSGAIEVRRLAPTTSGHQAHTIQLVRRAGALERKQTQTTYEAVRIAAMLGLAAMSAALWHAGAKLGSWRQQRLTPCAVTA